MKQKIIKIFATLLIMTSILTGCGNVIVEQENTNDNTSETIQQQETEKVIADEFVNVYVQGMTYVIKCHKPTDVLYVTCDGDMTVMVEADGTPLTYEEYMSYAQKYHETHDIIK